MTNHARKPFKMVMLAPTSVVGGIATWTKYFLRYYDSGKMRLWVIDNAKRYEEIGKESNLRGILMGVLNSFLLLSKLILVFCRRRPQLVYLTCSGYWSFFTRDLMLVTVSKWLGMKTLIHLRAGDIRAFYGHSRLSQWLSGQVMRRADRIIVITRDIEAHSMALYPQTVYLPNMLDEDVLHRVESSRGQPQVGQMKALHMAWQSPAKGTYDVIDACALLKDSCPDLVCDLVGRAAPEHEVVILRKIQESGLEGRVRLRPETVGDEKWKYFNEANLFLFPSRTEGFPNVILEAMCFGLPIIASNVGNIPEMVGWDTDSEAAWILKRHPVSAAELAETIASLISNPDLRRKMGENGRRRIRNYLAKNVMPQIEDLILHTLEEGKAS